MAKVNTETILVKAGALFARTGIDGFSIRKLARSIPISSSAIYYYFASETELLRAMFEYLNHELGQRRALLPQVPTAREMLKQRIHFQLDNQEAIVAVLKYYLAFRQTFPKHKAGFIPDKSALHIEEVLKYGLETKEFVVADLELDAKVITHAINGFLLEFFPHTPTQSERETIVTNLYSFISRAISK